MSTCMFDLIDFFLGPDVSDEIREADSRGDKQCVRIYDRRIPDHVAAPFEEMLYSSVLEMPFAVIMKRTDNGGISVKYSWADEFDDLD